MKTLSQSGYAFNFSGHGAFDPDGKLDGRPSQAEIDSHNSKLAREELQAMRETGKALLYLWSKEDGLPIYVGTWASKPEERIRIYASKRSRNNFGAQRTDIWFHWPDFSQLWHGVNIGDNDLVRCKRNKR